jgi:hypothetical protein
MLPAKFGSIWPSSFREDFFNISQSEKRIILGSHVYRPNGTKWRNFITRLGVIALFSSFFSSPDPKGHVRYCHHLASVVRPLTFHILIYSSETTGPLPSLAPFGQAVSEKIFLTLANQKQELPLAAIFVGGMGRNEETL